MKKILSGIAASTGKSQGKVRIVRDYGDTKKFQDGNVLVTVMTDPTMVIMMSKAVAIVSREMGIPCIVATKTATKTLKNGMEILVDGDKGKIYEISKMDR